MANLYQNWIQFPFVCLWFCNTVEALHTGHDILRTEDNDCCREVAVKGIWRECDVTCTVLFLFLCSKKFLLIAACKDITVKIYIWHSVKQKQPQMTRGMDQDSLPFPIKNEVLCTPAIVHQLDTVKSLTWQLWHALVAVAIVERWLW